MKQVKAKDIEKEIKSLADAKEWIHKRQQKLFVKDDDLEFNYKFITDRIEILKGILVNKELQSIQ